MTARFYLLLGFLLVSSVLWAQPTHVQEVTQLPYSALVSTTGTSAAYCADCQATNPCTASGTGAWAQKVGGTWECISLGTSVGLADPGANGIVTRTALDITGTATAADVDALFLGSGKCYLFKGTTPGVNDGCDTPAGGGGGGGVSGSGTANYFPLWTDTSVEGNSNLQAVTSPNGAKYTVGTGLYWQLDASHLTWNSAISGSNSVVIQNTYAPGSNNNAGGIVVESAPATGSACAGAAVLQAAGTNGLANGSGVEADGGCSNGYGAIGADIYVRAGSTIANNSGGNVRLVPGTGGFGNGNVVVHSGKILPFTGSTVPGLNVGYFSSAPSTTFANGDIWATSGGLYARIAGATVGPFGTGTGTVTSSGSPAAHQPAIFSGSTAITGASAGGADSIFMGNDAGATSDPAFKSGPGSCSGGSSAVTYNTGTHTWGCNTISAGSGTVTSVGATGTSNQITVTPSGANPITGSGGFTFSIPSAFIAPGSIQATTSLQAGTSTLLSCGSATGIWCAFEGSTAGTPTTGECYIRADSTNQFVQSCNGVAEAGIPQVGTPTVNHGACIKSAGPPVVIGYCSTVLASDGTCTCN